MIDKYLNKIEQIGVLGMLAAMTAYLIIMATFSYTYRAMFADKQYSPQATISHNISKNATDTLK